MHRMSSECYRKLVDEFNRTSLQYPKDGLIHELFVEQAALTPNAVAIVGPTRSLTYAQLNARANKFAHALLARGVTPETRIGVCAERSVETIVALLAVLKAGGAYVPLDPHYPRERLAFMVADSSPRVVLAPGKLAASVADLGVPVMDLDAEPSQPTDDPVVARLTSRCLAYVIYTSGSTGRPKGVMVEHRSVLRLVIKSTYAPIGRGDCVAHTSSPSFDAATWEVWASLLNGARLVIVPQDILLSPQALNDLLLSERVNALWLTVGLFHEYGDALADSFSRLDYLITGGDVIDPRVVARVLGKCPAPRCLINAYGPTETTTFATTFTIPATAKQDEAVPIGRPIDNTTVHILDENQRLVPIGEPGEICIGGPGVARGYLNQPALTAERFIRDPFCTAADAKLYRSGDLGTWLPDGNIKYLGRSDGQLKIRGFRVEPGEVEATIRRFAGVKQVAVIARTEADGQKRLIAYVVPELAFEQRLVSSLREYLNEQLPTYMRPALIVTLDALPLNGNGKVDRHALPAPAARAFANWNHEAPRGELEEVLARTWEQVLHVDRVGRNDNFIELGGDSLTATRLIVQLAAQFALPLRVDDLYQNADLSQLARLIAALRRDAAEPRNSDEAAEHISI